MWRWYNRPEFAHDAPAVGPPVAQRNILVQARRACCTLAALLLALSTGHVVHARDGEKPSVALKATPPLGFSPLRVHASVDVRGGADDAIDFYCPTIEWDWGDGTVSENSEDCDPYEAGKSSIKRRYSADHTFRLSGDYRLTFRLKQKDKVISSATTTLTVRAGVNEGF